MAHTLQSRLLRDDFEEEMTDAVYSKTETAAAGRRRDNIRFTMNTETVWGEEVYVVGNCPELGTQTVATSFNQQK